MKVIKVICGCLLLSAMFVTAFLYSQNTNAVRSTGSLSKVFEMAKSYEIAPMEKPVWAKRDDKPVFCAAWISDLHIREKYSLEMAKRACNTIRDILHPNFTLITGDNCGYVGKMSAEAQQLPVTHQRQLWLKGFLEQELSSPYVIIPGDNWPQDFYKVFGSFHRSFDFGGFHFHLAATDRAASNAEGCAIFNNKTWEWFEEDFAANKNKPSFFIIHETIVPPVFLDAGKTGAFLSRYPQALACLSGHLHLDLDFKENHWRQIVAPSLGRSHRPAFKYLKFYKDTVIIESYEWQQENNSFIQAAKWQQIPVPENLRSQIPNEPVTGFTPEQPRELPPAPKEIDQKLRERSQELSNNLMNFLFSFGMKQLFKTNSGK